MSLKTEDLVSIAIAALQNVEVVMSMVKKDHVAWEQVQNRYNTALKNFQETAKAHGKL
jgi:hypothetical protein